MSFAAKKIWEIRRCEDDGSRSRRGGGDVFAVRDERTLAWDLSRWDAPGRRAAENVVFWRVMQRRKIGG